MKPETLNFLEGIPLRPFVATAGSAAVTILAPLEPVIRAVSGLVSILVGILTVIILLRNIRRGRGEPPFQVPEDWEEDHLP